MPTEQPKGIPRPDKVVSKMSPPTEAASPARVLPMKPEMPPSDLFKKMAADLKTGIAELTNKKTQQPDAQEPAKTPPRTQETAQESTEDTQTTIETPPAAKTDSEGKIEASDDVPAIIKSPKAADEFRKLKSILSKQIKDKQDEILGLKKQLVEKTTEVAKAKLEPTEAEKQLELLKAERDELNKQLETVALERSPAFRKRYESKLTQALEQAKSAAGEHADKIETIAAASGKQRKELLSSVLEELDTADQLGLVAALNAHDAILRERNDELANHHATLKAQQDMDILANQQAEEVKMAKRQYVLNEVLKAAKSFEAFQTRNGDDEHNALVSDYENDVALFIAGKVDDAAAAFLPVLAAEGQYLKQRRVPELESRVKELEATITKLTGAPPSPKDGTSSKDDKVAAGRAEKAKTFIEAFRDAYAGPPLRNLR